MKIYEKNEFWIIVGVTVGFLLSAVWEVIKNQYSLYMKRKAIKSELQTNQGLIPQKIDILQKAKISLSQGNILRTASVHLQTNSYDSYIGEVGPNLSQLQRENLHIIYETMKCVDRILDNFHREFFELRASGQLNNSFQAYIDLCDDLIDSLNLATNMINDYLSGSPRVVTWQV